MVGRPRMDFLKSTKGGPFGSAGGRIPENGGVAPPPLNPPLAADKFKRNKPKSLFRHFLDNFGQKMRFSARAPLQNKYILAPKAPLEKLWGQLAKIGCLLIVQRGNLWVGRGRIPEGERRPPP